MIVHRLDNCMIVLDLPDIIFTILNNDDIFAVFDDRQQVVDMWRDNGLTVFQVADGDF